MEHSEKNPTAHTKAPAGQEVWTQSQKFSNSAEEECTLNTTVFILYETGLYKLWKEDDHTRIIKLR